MVKDQMIEQEEEEEDVKVYILEDADISSKSQEIKSYLIYLTVIFL